MLDDSKVTDTSSPPVVPDKLLLNSDLESGHFASDRKMAPHDSPGKIRLDGMRTRSSYSEAASNSGNSHKKDVAVPASKPNPADGKANENGSVRDADRDMDMDLDDGFSSMEMVDALPHQNPPAKESSVGSTAEGRDTQRGEENEKPDGESRSVTRKSARSRSQDNHDKRSFSKRKDSDNDAEEKTRLRRHVQDLYKKLNNLSTEKQIAEEKADRAANRVVEMKNIMNSDMTEIERDTASILEESDKVKAENRTLREQLNDAQSHIFSLQPYRKDLTPEEVGRVCPRRYIPLPIVS